MTKKLLLVAAIALINEKNEILMAQRPAGKEFAGLWEFPGGKVEIGETPENALIREVFEELNIIIKSSDLKPLTFSSYNYQNFHLLMPLWECRSWQGNPKSMEKQVLKFCNLNEILELEVPPADIELIKFLRVYLRENTL